MAPCGSNGLDGESHAQTALETQRRPLAGEGAPDPPRPERARSPADESPARIFRGGRVDGEEEQVIRVHPSPTADMRTCDYANVSKDTLLASSHQHICDVREGLQFFSRKIAQAMLAHDTDKITDIDGFHRDFVTGFTATEWWDRHRKLNRHHLTAPDGIPADVNLIDVLDFIADCVMAGMARSGSVYPLELSPGLLTLAFINTVELLKREVAVEPEPVAKT